MASDIHAGWKAASGPALTSTDCYSYSKNEERLNELPVQLLQLFGQNFLCEFVPPLFRVGEDRINMRRFGWIRIRRVAYLGC